MTCVIATAELKPGTQDAFLQEFHWSVPNRRAEQGCIAYGPTAGVPSGIKSQIPLREHVVTVVEQRESLDALRAHVVASHGRVPGAGQGVRPARVPQGPRAQVSRAPSVCLPGSRFSVFGRPKPETNELLT